MAMSAPPRCSLDRVRQPPGRLVAARRPADRRDAGGGSNGRVVDGPHLPIANASTTSRSPRFFCYLNLFTFSMLMLVTADNFIQLFSAGRASGCARTCWGGSGFDRPRPMPPRSGVRGQPDRRFRLALGIMGTFLVFNSVMFDPVFAAAPGRPDDIEFLGMHSTRWTRCASCCSSAPWGKSAQNRAAHLAGPTAMEGRRRSRP